MPLDELAYWSKIFEVLGSFAWPALVATIVIIFRKELAALINRIKEVKAGGFQIAMAELSEVSAAAVLEEPPPPEVGKKILRDDSLFFEMLKRSPFEVVVASYTELQSSVLSMRELVPESVQKAKIIDMAIINWLGNKEYIKPSTVELYSSLRSGRKAASRDSDSVTEIDAVVFRQNCLYLKAVLERVAKSLEAGRS